MRKIIFTGGTEGGREILQQAVPTIKPAVLELGGKGPIIVSEPIDWERGHRRRADAGVRAQGGGLFCRHAPVSAGRHARPVRRRSGRQGREDPDGQSARRPHPARAADDAAAPAGDRGTGAGRQEGRRYRRLRRREGQQARPGEGQLHGPDHPDRRHARHGVAKEELFGPGAMRAALREAGRSRSRWPTTPTSVLRATCGATTRAVGHRIAQELECGNVFINAYGYQSEIPLAATR